EKDSILGAAARIGNPGILAFAEATVAETTALDHQLPSFLYDDLHTENFLIHEKGKRLQGVIDFGDCRWGDVHFEFAALYRYDNRDMESAGIARKTGVFFFP